MISSVLFGIGIELDLVCGSRYVVYELSRLGFSVSSDEITQFKQSVMQSQPCNPLSDECYPSKFTQWVVDNVDHNLSSLDGRGTFRGMGIIAVSSRAGNELPIFPMNWIKRIARLKAHETTKSLGLDLEHFFHP